MERKERDNTIDFFRGLATLWIMFIHVCFHSGDMYVSQWLRSLSLIVDVPLLVFISGMTINLNKSFFKNIKQIIRLWIKWLLFLVLFYIVVFIFYSHENINIDFFLKTLFFNTYADGVATSVHSSLWFIYMFFAVILIGNIIIFFYNKYNKKIDDFKYILLLLFILMGIDMYNESFLPFSAIVLMYTFIYCLGYYLYNYKFKSWKSFFITMGINLVILALLVKYSVYNFEGMQMAKFVPHMTYLVYSMLSILTITYLKDRLKIKKRGIFCFVGKNALLFYYCQGLGASLVYFILPYVESLPATVLIMYVANVAISSAFFTIMYFADKLIKKIKWPKIIIFEKKKDTSL